MSNVKSPRSVTGELKQASDLSHLDLATLQRILSATSDGLSPEEAATRLEQFGPNEIPEKKINILAKLVSYFWGPIPWMIEGAILLSALVRHWDDFAIIFVLLITNALVGFWEEYHAAGEIAALKARLALKATVKRAGAWTDIAARDLVPGDRIRVRLGDIIAADARLIEGESLEVDQSALTGESLPVSRNSGDAVYSGSVIKRGEMDALVYATGAHTYFGKTAALVEQAQTRSHFQRAVLKIGDFLIVIAASLVSIILLVALFRGDPIFETLEFALVLIVAAIPVAMPTVLSVTMAVGARILAKKDAIVSRLAAIEELAGMDILCSDKTGTLTENRLTLGDPFVLEGLSADELMITAALASRSEDNDVIDEAIFKGLRQKSALDKYQVTAFQPFDPVRKRTEAQIKGDQATVFRVSKGAPQVILALATDRALIESKVKRAIDDFASRGYRSLGVARTDETGAWRFLGILPLHDPPRKDSKLILETAKQMGITVKMVTGDQLAIAKEVARDVGLGTNLLDAAYFGEMKPLEMAKLGDAIETADGFAQVFPEHKYHIVEVLQNKGHIVGMTGDGVNDAPALKKADAGIAVSGATDAARAAADIVCLSPGLSVIIDAIKESRKIFQRMNSYAIYRITETIRVLLLMTLSILIFNFYPVTAVMIVLLALLNDGAILSIAYDRVRYSNTPEVWNMRLVLGIATVLGVTGVLASFGLFYLGERVWHLNRETIQTLIYLKLSVAGHLTIFVTRTRGAFWSIRPARSLFCAVVGTQLIATFFAVNGVFMEPIGWKWALIVWGYALAWFLLNDRIKIWAYHLLSPNESGFFVGRARPTD